MQKCKWKKNIILSSHIPGLSIRSKIIIKTDEASWVQTNYPVVLPLSVRPFVHEEPQEIAKIHALLSLIKDNVKGKITVFFTDKTNLQDLKVLHPYLEDTQKCNRDAQALFTKYQPFLKGFDVVFWNNVIKESPDCLEYSTRIKKFYNTDPRFRYLVNIDSEQTDSDVRIEQFPNTQLYLEKSKADVLQDCVCRLIFAAKGYRFIFYSSKPNTSCEYANRLLLPKNHELTPVHVFLSINKYVVHPQTKEKKYAKKLLQPKKAFLKIYEFFARACSALYGTTR